MFVGVSVVLAVFSYLAYRHLYIYADTAGSAGGGSGGPATNASDINTSMSASSSSSSGTTAGKEAEAAAPLSVWPFFSTILRQSQSSLSESSSELKRLRGGAAGGVNGAVCIVPDIHTTTSDQTDARLSADKQKKQQEEESPCTTPRARPVRLSPNNGLTIPMISLDDPDSDNDTPPSFPAMNSAQRAGGGGGVWSSLGMPPPLIPIRNMAPPPVPSRNPKNQNPSMWSRPAAPNPNSAARSRLQVVGAGASGVAAGNGLSLPKRDGGSGGSSSKSRMVLLEPGHSPLDWARLQKSGIDLRSLPHGRLLKVAPSLLAQHKSLPDDVWMALNGKVYNISAYIPFHPGGEKELMRGAGKDGTKLFNATHPWVNIEGMLEECLVGILVSEDEARVEVSALDLVD